MRRRFPFRRLLAALAVPLFTAWVSYAQPALQLDPLPDGQVRLRWSSEPGGYVLESATDLSAPTSPPWRRRRWRPEANGRSRWPRLR